MHFDNNDHVGTHQGPSKLSKIYPVLSHLNTKFQSLYLPGQNIAIDDSLTLWTGRLSFRQYIPLKSSKFGIKSYELFESSSGYLWSFIIYTGKDTFPDSIHFRQQKQNSSNCVVTCGDIAEKGPHIVDG